MELQVQEASLNPPGPWCSAEDDHDAAAGIPWTLLELDAYVADHRNHTTAFSRTRLGKEIQVTFFFARPPRVSYFCVFCPGRDHEEFPVEPRILAMDDDLVLLHIILRTGKTTYTDSDLYIYQANGGDNGKPSLCWLPPPPGNWVFMREFVGLLRCSDDDNNVDSSILRRCSIKKADFIIAALFDPYNLVVYCEISDEDKKYLKSSSDVCYALYLYNSKSETWTVSLVSLDQQQLHKQPRGGKVFLHFTSKVIAVGGEAGTIGFVDLYRGIILCDVLKGDHRKLRYIPLPPPIRPDDLLIGEASLERDIAVVEGCIKYLELMASDDPTSLVAGADGWMVRAWSMPVVAAVTNADAAGDWIMDSEVLSSDDINVENNQHFELLPAPQDKNFQPLQLPPFRGFAVFRPALSLSDDDTICLMNKIFYGDKKAWVMAVGVGKKELLGVAEFASERIEALPFAYTHGRISKYLTELSGADRDGRIKHGLKLPRWSIMKEPSKIPADWINLSEATGAISKDEDNMIGD